MWYTTLTFIHAGFWVAYRPGARLKSGDRQVERWHLRRKPAGWFGVSVTRPGLCVVGRTLADVRADLAAGVFCDLAEEKEKEGAMHA